MRKQDLIFCVLQKKAEKEGKYSAATVAEMARGKVAGFYVDRVEMNAKVMGTVSYRANMPKRGKA